MTIQITQNEYSTEDTLENACLIFLGIPLSAYVL